MSALSLLDAIERPSILGPEPGEARDEDRRHVTAAGGVPTLDDVLSATWETLTAGSVASCLMCGGALEPRYGAGHAPVGGRCTRCSTELS